MELKKRDCAQVQTEMIEFIALPFLFSSKLKIWLFQIVIVQGQQCYLLIQKSLMLGRVVVLLINPLLFLTFLLQSSS